MSIPDSLTRRTFIQAAGISGAGGAFAQSGGVVPKRSMGNTGLQVSMIGIGGYHIGSAKDEKEATQILNQALDAGVNFFDNAWEYHNGESEERVGRALKGKRDQVILMTKVCTHGRDKSVAMRMLEESLPPPPNRPPRRLANP